MRRDELSRTGSVRRLDAEPGEQLAGVAKDADARTEIRSTPVELIDRARLTDVADRLSSRRRVKGARSVHVVPHGLEATIAVKDLYPVVLPICDVDPSVGVCLLYTSPSPRDRQKSRMPSS